MSGRTSAVDLTQTRAGYVISHSGFGVGIYASGLRSSLLLYNTAETTELIIDFFDFNLGASETCTTTQSGNTFRVLRGSDGQQLYTCGDTRNAPDQVTIPTLSADSILLEFTTSSSRDGGFLLRYSGTYCCLISGILTTQ